MEYFKVIQNQSVVDVGSFFLHWNAKYHQYFYCDINDAQLVQGMITEKLYHGSWLKSPSDSKTEYEEAEIVMIEASEYDELKATLESGEEIPYSEPVVDILPETPEETDQPEEERPMTIQEMRYRIQLLTDCLMEMSEIVYA